MFQPLSVFIGLRYVRSRQHKFFVSLITWVSLAGVSLGVAALIVILSVMNGFEGELRERLLSLNAQAHVTATGVAAPDGEQALRERLQRLPGVVGVAPYIELTALAVRLPEMLPVVLRGITPALEAAVADVRPLLVEGSIDALTAGSNAVILGRDIADQLGVRVGDQVTLLVPTASANGTPEPRLRQFSVGGVFQAGLEDHDNTLILANFDDVRAFAPLAQGASGLRLRFTDALQVGQFMPAVRAAAGRGYTSSDWTQENASYFRAIRIEKTMMALILLLIVAVAAFNIVAMLVMVVNDKRTDIAILRTFGTSPQTIMRTFITQGLAIGWFGVAAGVALGVLLARNVSTIVPVLERLLHFQFLDAQVYYITSIPSELHPHDIAWISGAAFMLTLLSTIYPALRAARTPPADALRYE
ncbi:MAG TPA: lipoprotein-releasing ABC transporter permease subunit [Steroidobacteraceae bacterium]|jgi:lipoprotein-releasing system permease protein|nr:lipoprotein-releasing ABC transporter permease subunit [Steroidobacteraceae bacterium]